MDIPINIMVSFDYAEKKEVFFAAVEDIFLMKIMTIHSFGLQTFDNITVS